MKSSVKSMLTELVVAVVCVAAVALILGMGLSSCASASTVETTSTERSLIEKSVQPEKKNDTTEEIQPEYTKTDFVQDLKEVLNKEGAESALEFFDRKIPENLADDFDLLFLKAAINVSANDLDEAQEICTNLSERDPQNEDVLSLAVAIAKMKGDSAERTKQLNALLAKDKLNSAANVELGEDFFMKKNYRQSKVYYKRALVREPENVDALRGLGQCDYYLENDNDAIKSFQKILEIEPDNTQAFLYLGKIAYANNEYKTAADYAKKALELEPQNYECNLDYGMYERYSGHYDAAEKAWTAAIQIEPDYFLAYAYRAGLYDEQDIFSKAIEDYKSVIRLNPQYYYAYESLGILALHEENWTTARESFMKCFESNKNNISYPLMITYCYYREKNPSEAKKFSDQVLRRMDRNSMDYTMLRLFHDQAGERSVPQKISAMTNRNQQGKMYYYLGLFYDMFGGTEFANEYYAKVVGMSSPMFFEYRLAEWRTKGKIPLKK